MAMRKHPGTHKKSAASSHVIGTSREKKPLLIRIKVENAGEKEQHEIHRLIEEVLSEHFKRVDIEFD